jgi:hypothetical protein
MRGNQAVLPTPQVRRPHPSNHKGVLSKNLIHALMQRKHDSTE